jgi:large repetitive protein
VPPFLAPATGASAALTTVAETNSNGQASVTATANGTSGSYNVTVTEQNTTATFTLTNNAGTPTAANSNFALPPTALAGAIVTGTLTLKDQDGNLVPPTSVTFTKASNTTTFSTPTTVMTANGVATISFSDTKAETVTISVNVGGTPFLSGTVQITPAAPASVSVVSGTPQSATVNTQFAAPLVMVIEDKYGNPTPNVAVPSFVVPATGASVTLTTVAETNSNGQANVTATANGTSGSYNVTVTEQNTTATFALTNNATTQTIAFTPPASPVTYGVAPITLVASASSQLPVSFAVTGPVTVNGSILTITGAGTVGITASQTGNPTYAAATPVMRSLTVYQQPTITSVSASPATASPAQPVTLTAMVAATIAGTPTMPSGTVIFLDNGVQLGTAVNVVNGAATLTVPSLPSGATDSITATYSGNDNFLASTSSNNATVTVASLDFSFTNTGTTAYTTAPGAVATYSFGLSPLYGSYAGTLNFTVTGLPAGATASFTPSTVAVGSGATPVVMTVQTSSATAHNRNPFGHGIVLALLFLPFAGKRSVREKLKGRMLLILLLMAGLTATLTGCGSTSGFLLQTPQTYTLTVTATSGALQHSQVVTLIVQ